MDNQNLIKGFACGLGAYIACLLPPMLPIFQPALGPETAGQLTLAAAVASALVALMLLTGFDRRVGDAGARFTQALLGMGVCAGLYALVAPVSEPQVVLMSLIWMALGLTLLTPGKVLVLASVYLTLYMNAYTRVLLDAAAPRHADALYVLLVSLTLCAFMYLRAHEYERARQERQLLQDENAMQAVALEDAREHIHTITSQDMDTIALKFPFFKEELRSCKQRADASETTFCAGLISIDHYSELSARYDEDVIKQVVRTVVERAVGVIHDLQVGELDAKRPPLGRVGDGLFGMILPRANLKGAEVCARKLRQAVELQSIKTMAGLVNITLTVGVVEYHPGETVGELLSSMGAALEKGRLDNFEEEAQAVQATKRAPVKAAGTAQELRLLHYKEYDAPVH